MTKISSPLKQDMQGPEVGDLQDALQLLLDKGIILRGNENDRQERSTALQLERAKEVYGRITRELVRIFQEDRGLEENGEVDEATVYAINNVVNSLETVEPSEMKTFIVRGHVREVDGTPFTEGRVLAYDKGLGTNKTLLGGTHITDSEGFYEISYTTQNLNKDNVNLLVEVEEINENNEEDEPITLPHDVIYNASQEETVELVVDRNKYQGRSEYNRLVDKVEPALERMPLKNLISSDDIKVVAANTRLNPSHIEFLAEAARFTERTKLSNEIGYVIARQNLPTSPRLLMLRDRQSIRQIFEKAINENLIPKTCIDDMINDLHTRAVDEELEIVHNEDGDFTLGTLFNLSPVLTGDMARQRAFVDVYFEHVRNIDTLWEKLRDRPEFDDEKIIDEFKFMMELSTLTSSISLADAIQAELRQRAEPLQHYDLARLDLPSLRQLAESAGVPPDQVEAKAIEIFRPIEARFPTRVFFHHLERENEELPGANVVQAFLSKKLAEEPDFDLGRNHILNYLSNVGKTEMEQLLSWQRVYRIAPVQDRYEAIRTLKKMPDLDSATAITNIRKGPFMRRFTAAMENDNRASELALKVWKKSIHVHNMALSLLTDFSPAFNRVVPFSIPYFEIKDQNEDAVSLEDLFGSLDYCECNHCESLYSPAAYLVDLLNFLQTAKLNKDGVSPYGVLLTRRPDLAMLELSCENTETLIPYIDLVNEILEDAVVSMPIPLTKCPDKKLATEVHPAQPFIIGYGTPFNKVNFNPIVDKLTPQKITELLQPVIPKFNDPVPLGTVDANEWISSDKKYMVLADLSNLDNKLLAYLLKTIQTKYDSITLGILPQTLNLNAYKRLAKEVYPWNLPFDLEFEEARIYLQHLQFKRYLWMERFGHPEIDVACSNLNLTPLEHDLIAGKFRRKEEEYWGLPEGYQLDDLYRVKFFMRQAGFDILNSQSFKETRRLLIGTYFINKDGSLDIPILDDMCDLACLKIAHSAGLQWDETLERIRRFVRLQRKLGWTSTELDKAIMAFSADLNDEFLQHLSCIKRLNADLRVPLVEMFGWWGMLDTAEDRVEKVESKKEKSLYEKLFLNLSVENPADKLFELNNKRSDLIIREAKFTQKLRAGTILNKAFFLKYFNKKYKNEAFQPHIEVTHYAKTDDWVIKIVNKGQEYWAWRDRNQLNFSILQRITTNASKVTSALEISAADLDILIITAKNPDGEVPDILNLANLSHLFRISSLSKALDLKIKEFLSAKALIGIDPFKDPKTTLEFVDKIRKIQTSQFSIIELDYLFRHEFEVQDDVALPETEIRRKSDDLRNGLLKIKSETISVPDPKGEVTRQKLAMLLTPEQIREIMTVISGEEKDEMKQNTLIEKLLGAYLDVNDAKKNLVGNNPLRKSQGERFEYILEAILNYLRSTFSENYVKQQLSSFLSLDTDLTKPLLESLVQGHLTKSVNGLKVKNKHVIEDFLELAKSGLFNDIIDPKLFIGLLRAPQTEEYSLAMPKGVNAKVMINEKIVVDTSNNQYQSIELKAGEYYNIQILFTSNAPDEISLFWKTTSQVEQPIPKECMVPADIWQACRTSLILLHKLALVTTKFKMKENELRYLAAHGSDFANFDLNKFPTAKTAAIPDLFKQWEILLDVFAFRDLYPQRDTPLLEVFHAAADQLIDEAKKRLVSITGWDTQQLDVLAGEEGIKLSLDEYKCGTKFIYLHDTFRVLKQLGISAEQFLSLLEKDLDKKDLRQIVKAKYSQEEWPKIAKPLQDELREKRRVALVTFLVYANCLDNSNDLFEYYLIDVEMSSCMMTSRLKQAISSVQTFIQRCLMNLETKVTLDADDAQEWKWRKYYRVWEANRKVLLYPENWIEPDLRDDKSPFFEELENELLQNEISDENVEKVFLKYLQKVDEVSRLEIVGIYEQTDGWFESKEKQTKNYVLHVFGRTRGTPHRYYYRRWIDRAYWTPWERVELDIEGNHLIPVVWNRKLYLFWPVFEEKTFEKKEFKKDNEKSKSASKYWQIKLAWSCYQSEKWSTKIMPPNFINVICVTPHNSSQLPRVKIIDEQTYLDDETLYDSQLEALEKLNLKPPQDEKEEVWYIFLINTETPQDETELKVLLNKPFKAGIPIKEIARENFIFKGIVDESNELLVRCFLEHVYPQDKKVWDYWPIFEFRLSSYNAELSSEIEYTKLEHRLPILMPEGTKITNMSCTANSLGQILYLPTFFYPKNFNVNNENDLMKLHSFRNDKKVLNRTDGYFKLLFAHQYLQLDSEYPLFYEDQNRTFFIEPYIPMIKSGTSGMNFIPATYKLDSYSFNTFYHPYIIELIKLLNVYGIDGLLNPSLYKEGKEYQYQLKQTEVFIKNNYDPILSRIKKAPIEDFNFQLDGAYSLYNWELFFHIPLLIADRLSKNQKFEESMHWFHYIFDPTETSDGEAPAKFWNVRPFYESYQQQKGRPKRIQELMKLLNDGNPELEAQISAWEGSPFKPHLIARRRVEAYMKMVVMKYIDNLLAWGDQLYRRETIELINEATQLYILAANLLGVCPQEIPLPRRSNLTFNDLKDKLDPLSNASIKIEVVLPESLQNENLLSNVQQQTVNMLYFCVPNNDKLSKYWYTVADRLFKIRHCMDIEGKVRQLPLFEPPIDPALLVRATAAGVDIGSVLNDLYAPLPHYRFNTMVQKAAELCSEVKSLGAAMLAALEKKDAEDLALMRSTHEIKLLESIKEVKKKQIDEAKDSLEGAQKAKELADIKYQYYKNIKFMNSNEKAHLDLMSTAAVIQAIGQMLELAASFTHPIPDFYEGVAGWASTPVSITAVGGGSKIAPALQAFGRMMGIYSSILSMEASTSATLGGYQRRADDWKLQEQLASKEQEQIDKQILAAEIRQEIAKIDLRNHELQIENAKEIDTWIRINKFTNKQLYSWMVSQISTLYFQTYQLAYDMSKRAEKAFQYELGLSDSSFIQFGYWDSLKEGLLAGERLYHDIKRMEAAYLDQNKRECEIIKHISLAMLDPIALINLKGKGECFINLPEALFDLDYPGHYMRRIKNVSISIPCVTGPYTSINCTLSLSRSSIRKSPLLNKDKYERLKDDDRFIDYFGSIQSIVTSSGNNDSGMFETNLRDERFLPFEGAGVISEWRLELSGIGIDNKNEPVNFASFDFDTISDVILHIRYTAWQGGESLKGEVIKTLSNALNTLQLAEDRGLFHMFSMRTEFPNEWHRFFNLVNYIEKDANNQQLEGYEHEFKVDLSPERLSYLFRHGVEIGKMELFIKLKEGVEYDVNQPLTFDLKRDDKSQIEGNNQQFIVYKGSNGDEFQSLLYACPFDKKKIELSKTEKWCFEVKEKVLDKDGNFVANLPTTLVKKEKLKIGNVEHDHLDSEVIEDLWMLLRFSLLK